MAVGACSSDSSAAVAEKAGARRWWCHNILVPCARPAADRACLPFGSIDLQRARQFCESCVNRATVKVAPTKVHFFGMVPRARSILVSQARPAPPRSADFTLNQVRHKGTEVWVKRNRSSIPSSAYRAEPVLRRVLRRRLRWAKKHRSSRGQTFATDVGTARMPARTVGSR